MKYSELDKALTKVFGRYGYAIETDNEEQLLVYTGLYWSDSSEDLIDATEKEKQNNEPKEVD